MVLPAQDPNSNTLQPLVTRPTTFLRRQSSHNSLLTPQDYDNDASSIRSEQDSDSDDDERQARARNSTELRAHDRLVLMEEEELDQLVTETRRKQERQRRGKMDEKRSRRRERRRVKRERLFGEAEAGEDGELLHEMEAGSMKDGSDTGESSDRDDESDRRLLGADEIDEKMGRGRRWGWKRWMFILSIIGTAFAILFLLAWKLSMRTKLVSHQSYISNGTALFAPTTIIISLDGFRADFLNRGLTPNLNKLIRAGVSPPYMTPSFPSVTFPNHFTLATGLYPESHGVVGNTFWDPELKEEFYYTDPARSLDPKWWNGEPFWVTAEKQGLRTAVHMWPGSDVSIEGVEPTFMDKYSGRLELPRKAERVFELLDRPGREDPAVPVAELRPQLFAVYVPNVDSMGHKFGPNSTEIRDTIQKADDMVGLILQGLEQRNLTHIVNVIVVSDHGMATTDTSRLLQLEDLVDLNQIEHLDGWPLIGLRPKDDAELGSIHGSLLEKAQNNPGIDVYLRDEDMPERYHFSSNHRIAPLWIVPKAGWALVTKKEMDLSVAGVGEEIYHPRGLHGYDHEHPLMRAIFIAKGPAFAHPPGSRLEAFQNIEVYNILCDSVGLVPTPNNGTLRLPLSPVGLHDTDGDGIATPADPGQPTANSSEPQPPSVSASTSRVLSTLFPTTTSIDDTELQSETSALPYSSPATEPPSATDVSTATSTASTTPVQPTPTDAGDPDANNNSGNFWDWLTDKVNHIWDKISGSS
ncbi:hypothetical protein DL546_003367 [Coniochaeta pulveracea]|uniref:Ectonucleotide pyrophosphatase phosphodiesterase n=1 Tax=Coniochaeta pulveracea TaxID=177199 RepID=A0A420Y8S0_9PEZI|nr:hypothetical protein DL546_003367 [Coniochaeta pulveracea]